jgi:hypothetical protein
MEKLFLATLVAVFFCSIANAQSQFSGWLASFNTFKTSSKTSIHTDIQLRSSDEFVRVQTLLLRAGLNVPINKKMVITAGYAYVHNYRTLGLVNGYLPEHRAWEQFLFSHKLKAVLVSHRLRIEQRFIPKTFVENDELKSGGYVYAGRVRYFVRGILPLKKQPVFKQGAFVALQNEVFLNVGNTANVNGKIFDQNRFYIATGYRFSKAFDLEAGYMNQYINGRSATFTNNHIMQLAGYVRL